MALIECAEALSVSTKAKLQDAGFLYVSDVVSLLCPEKQLAEVDGSERNGDTMAHQRVGALVEQELAQQPSSDEAGPIGAASADTAPRSSAESITASLHEAGLAGLTEDELEEVAELAVQAATSAHGGAGAGRDASTSPPVLRASTTAPSPTSLCSPLPSLPFPPSPGAAPRRIPGCRTLRELCAEAAAAQTHPTAAAPTHATTFSQRLDHVLGGGAPVGGVTEVAGPPGVGKTQLLLQLAVSCAMPVEFGGLGGTCLFVDTEGSFVAERLEQIATAAVSLVRGILARQAPASRKRPRSPPPGGGGLVLADTFTVESVLRRVRYVRVTDLAGLLALLHSLPAWLSEDEALRRTRHAEAHGTKAAAPPPPRHPHTAPKGSEEELRSGSDGDELARLRMLLIDSVALPFRSADSFEKDAVGAGGGAGFPTAPDGASSSGGLLSRHGLWQRARLVFQCSTLLEHLAGAYQLAIVATNHMTSKTIWEAPAPRAAGQSGGTAVAGAEGGEAGAPPPLRQTVLVPALGDAWAHGLATRLLLCFHHYDVPACGVVEGPTETSACAEGVAHHLTPRHTTATAAAQSPSAPPPLSLPSVAQHRVARVVKCSGLPRRETCFLLTGKGIRDVRHDMVAQRVSALGGGHAAAAPASLPPPFL